MKYLFFLFFLLVPGFLSAQEKLLQKAQEYYSIQQYSKALDYFLQSEGLVSGQNQVQEVQLKIASCYSNLHNPIDAVIYFEKALHAGVNLNSDQEIEYAGSLIELGNYTKAKEFLKISDDGLYIEQILLEKCDYSLANDSSDKRMLLVPVPQPNDYSIYGITTYKGKIFYVLHKELAAKEKQDYLFVYDGDEDKSIEKLRTIELPLNFNSPSFDTENNCIYFSGNASNYQKYTDSRRENNKIGEGGVNNLFIWSYFPDQKSNALKIVSFNNIDFSCTHPCITDSGKTMYFSSNMLGGFGGFDLYKVSKLGNKWGEPVNMGRKINTFLNEGYPFVKDGFLYFASEGHPGFGGLDIFKMDLSSGDIENIGKPINSSFDDFSYVPTTNGDGYFISNRSGKNGKDVMYKIIKSKE